MRIKPQIIEHKGKPAFVVVPFDEWVRLQEIIEDAEDEAAIRAFREQPEETFPAEVVRKLVDGKNPVAVFREYRGLTQRALAEAAGITQMYVSQIETGSRKGTVKVLRQIADALKVDLDDVAR